MVIWLLRRLMAEAEPLARWVMLRIGHGAFQRFTDQCGGFFRHEIKQVERARGGQTLNFASDFPRLEGRDALLTGDGSDFHD